MRNSILLLLLALMLCFLTLSCSNVDLLPLEGEPAELAREFISSLAKGDYEECAGYFDAKMARAMNARKLEKTWNDLESQAGSYVGEVSISEDIVDGYDVVFVTSEFEKDSLIIRVVFDEARRVAGLWFGPSE